MVESKEELVRQTHQAVVEVEKVIVGKQRLVQLVFCCLLADGHALLDDVPGVGKTMLARAIAGSLGCKFTRVQATPDLLPSDVTGSSIFNQLTQEFEFKPGPVFTNILLVDEINRATPKTQSSLLECMGEGQVSADKITYELPKPFFVIATDNPIEHHGVFPLPVAQLDRFTMKLSLGYPGRKDEVKMLTSQRLEHPISQVEARLDSERVIELQRHVREVFVDPTLDAYVVSLTGATRSDSRLTIGASPRGSISLIRTSQALALLTGRDYVLPEDIKAVAPYVLVHRLVASPEARARQMTEADIITSLLTEVPAPPVQRVMPA